MEFWPGCFLSTTLLLQLLQYNPLKRERKEMGGFSKLSSLGWISFLNETTQAGKPIYKEQLGPPAEQYMALYI
jgi:hypothetical protein